MIIWGSYVDKKQKGVVADVCGHCQKIEPFVVTTYVRVNHVYFIPLSRDKAVYGRKCGRCDAEFFDFTPKKYDRMIGRADAELLSIDELLEETNSPLNDHVQDMERQRRQGRDAFESDRGRASSPGWDPVGSADDDSFDARRPPGRSVTPAPSDADSHELLAQAHALLAAARDHPAKAALLQSLGRWPTMTAEDRVKALGKVKKFLAAQDAEKEIVPLLQRLGASVPTLSGRAWLIALLALAAGVSAIWLVPVKWDTPGMVMYLVHVVIAVFVILKMRSLGLQKKWMREWVIPEIEASGQNPVQVQQFLAHLEPGDPRACTDVRKMIPHAASLQFTLRVLDKWAPAQERR